MRILVVAATGMEIAPFIKTDTGTEALITGVGIPATVYHLTKKLLQEKYNLVIQAGIAGSFSKKIKSGELVAVQQDAFGDIGAEVNKHFKTIFELGLGDENEFPFTDGRLFNTCDILQRSTLQKVNAVTVNKIYDRRKQVKQLKKTFDADIESMEGAAFHFVCLQHHVPFLQIRSISNTVGERDKTKWHIKEAIENLNTELIQLVDTIHTP
jgi:futalosine hydrolase